jgi:hypothetical protein
MSACRVGVLTLIVAVTASLRADAPTSRPASVAPTSAKTTEEITKSIEPFKGFGCIQTAQFNRWGHQVFALWYCPFSGRGDCYLHAYYYDYDKAQWMRFVDQLVEAGGDLSPEITAGEELVVHGFQAKIVLRESISNFPEKKSAEAK